MESWICHDKTGITNRHVSFAAPQVTHKPKNTSWIACCLTGYISISAGPHGGRHWHSDPARLSVLGLGSGVQRLSNIGEYDMLNSWHAHQVTAHVPDRVLCAETGDAAEACSQPRPVTEKHWVLRGVKSYPKTLFITSTVPCTGTNQKQSPRLPSPPRPSRRTP